MSKWKGDATVLAANRALAAEATLAEMVWRKGLARKTGDANTGIRARMFIRGASRAAAQVADLADRMQEVADRHERMQGLANWHHANASQAEAHATRAYAAIRRAGIPKEA